MRVQDPDPRKWPIVISLHGIRTTGRWQKELNDVLTQSGYRHIPLDFGFFDTMSLLWPSSRARKVEWFHRVYSEKFASLSARPSLIAHSFGTYIVTMAMLKYEDIRFDRVILCGSLARRDYPWGQLILERKQVARVLNEGGGHDVWVRLAEFLIEDVGTSGVHGFVDDVKGRVTNVLHDKHRHSDYFYAQNYEQRWLPFLSGAQPKKVSPIRKMSTNSRYYIFMGAIGFLLIFLVIIGFILSNRNLDGSDDEENAVISREGSEEKGVAREEKVVIPDLPESTWVDDMLQPLPAEPLPPLPRSPVDPVNVGDSFPPQSREQLHEYLLGSWLAKKPVKHRATPYQNGSCYEEIESSVRLEFSGEFTGSGALSGRWEEFVLVRRRFSQSSLVGSPSFGQAVSPQIAIEQVASDRAACLEQAVGVTTELTSAILMNFSGKITVSFDRYSDANGLPFVTKHTNCSEKCALSEFNKNSYFSFVSASKISANSFEFQKQ